MVVVVVVVVAVEPVVVAVEPYLAGYLTRRRLYVRNKGGQQEEGVAKFGVSEGVRLSTRVVIWASPLRVISNCVC